MNQISGLVRGSDGILMADVPVYAYKLADGTLLGSALSGDGTLYTAGDEYYDDVALLLHCDGADGTTDFIDHSHSPKTVTAYGNAQITTLQSKFGGASAMFDGVGDYLITSNVLDNYAGSFTFELWFKLNSTSQITGNEWYNSAYIVSAGPSFSNDGFDFALGSTTIWLSHFSGNSRTLSASWTPDTNWHHLAVTRYGNNFTLWLDGVSIATNTSTANTASSSLMAFARCEPAGEATSLFDGHMDDIRITKGVARYTANFTPPTETFYDNAPILARPEGRYTILTEYADKVICTCNNSLESGLSPLVLRTTPVPV